MSFKITRLFYAVLIVSVVISIDQALKVWVLNDLMNPPVDFPLFPFVDLVLAWNKGVGFGFLQAKTFWGMLGLIGVASGISVGLGVWIWRTTDTLLLISLSLIIGGAIGNMIDRIMYGAVVDFIYVHVYIFGYHFPAFNFADSAITVGVGLLLLESYVREKK